MTEREQELYDALVELFNAIWNKENLTSTYDKYRELDYSHRDATDRSYPGNYSYAMHKARKAIHNESVKHRSPQWQIT